MQLLRTLLLVALMLPAAASAADLDNDGVDADDVFPNNSLESADEDGDGIGDNEDNADANMATLRDRATYFGIGRAPNDAGTVTIRHGLFAQGPFSNVAGEEIDIAASGFALTQLPGAVDRGLIGEEAARSIALAAASRTREMIENSVNASDAAERGMYGTGGMLPHFAEWHAAAGEFRRGPASEVSSIDTALLLYGLMVNAQYFGGDVATNYLAARDAVDWRAWIDVTTSGHVNHFRQSYDAASDSLPDFWYDTYSHEIMLLVIMAAMSDPTLDVVALWRAWNRQTVSYGGRSTYATWNGDPFTVFYGL